MCSTCYSYWREFKELRPPELILWPNKGHPLATSAQVSKITGLSYRVIDYAIREGLVTTTVVHEGSGHSRGWSVPDVVRLLASYARSKFPSSLDGISGIELDLNEEMLTDWVIARWPLDAYYDWDGSLP